MTSIRGLGPLPELIAAEHGEAVLERVFQRSGIGPNVAWHADDRMMPLRDLIAVYNHASDATGDPLIGLKVGRAMVDEFGAWTRYHRTAPTLRASLVRLVRTFPFHQSGGSLRLETEGETARLVYGVALGGSAWQAQHFEHAVPALLSTLRLYLGEHWEPDRVEIDYPATGRHAALERGFNSPVVQTAATRAVCFDREALDAHRIEPVEEFPASWSGLLAFARSRPPRSMSGILHHVLHTRLAEQRTDLDSVSAHLDLTPRTIQRRLSDERSTFRQVLDGVRIARAEELFSEQSMSLTEIAYHLGYSDVAHFSRAFRRITERSPREYRAALQAGAIGRRHG